MAHTWIFSTYITLRRLRRNRTLPRRRRMWVHPIVTYRSKRGVQRYLFEELPLYPNKFFQFFRMSVSSFNQLLSILTPHIRHQDTYMRKSISPKERLAVTLRYLATGCSFQQLYFMFRIGISTLSKIINEVCCKIWMILRPSELPTPTGSMWNDAAVLFEKRANFPNCIGAIDGKHIKIIKPHHTGSLYFNYKKYFSFVLLAVCDANYCFTLVDIGDYGKNPDSSIFQNSKISGMLNRNQLGIPPSHPLPGEDGPSIPMVFVGDEAFSLSYHIMRPYSGKNLVKKKRIFNYRLSRARRFIECTFGIMSNKWRILHRALNVDINFAINIVKACTILHNYVRRRDGFKFSDTLQHGLNDCPADGDYQMPRIGADLREYFANYFEGPGAIPWQESRI